MRPSITYLPALLAVAVLASSVSAAPTSACAATVKRQVYLTVEEALELAFPKAKVERTTVYLTKAQRKRVSELAGTDLESSIAYPYVARDAKGQYLGTAYFETHRVRSLDETVMAVVNPRGRVARVELLAFGEPPDYVPRESWYAQFKGHGLDEDLNLNRGIRNVTGATLTARATTRSARRLLALHQVLGEASGSGSEPKRADTPR